MFLGRSRLCQATVRKFLAESIEILIWHAAIARCHNRFKFCNNHAMPPLENKFLSVSTLRSCR